MPREYCPFHADEDIEGTFVSGDVGYAFACDRSGHPEQGSYTWTVAPEAPESLSMSGLAAELNLWVNLTYVVSAYPGRWVEYGVIERAYAAAHPADWSLLVERFGHTAIASKGYTVSTYLAKALGSLASQGAVAYHDGKATGRWSYNPQISWWAAFPEPEWMPANQLSWADDGPSTAYVPGEHRDTLGRCDPSERTAEGRIRPGVRQGSAHVPHRVLKLNAEPQRVCNGNRRRPTLRRDAVHEHVVPLGAEVGDRLRSVDEDKVKVGVRVFIRAVNQPEFDVLANALLLAN